MQYSLFLVLPLLLLGSEMVHADKTIKKPSSSYANQEVSYLKKPKTRNKQLKAPSQAQQRYIGETEKNLSQAQNNRQPTQKPGENKKPKPADVDIPF